MKNILATFRPCSSYSIHTYMYRSQYNVLTNSGLNVPAYQGREIDVVIPDWRVLHQQCRCISCLQDVFDDRTVDSSSNPDIASPGTPRSNSDVAQELANLWQNIPGVVTVLTPTKSAALSHMQCFHRSTKLTPKRKYHIIRVQFCNKLPVLGSMGH